MNASHSIARTAAQCMLFAAFAAVGQDAAVAQCQLPAWNADVPGLLGFPQYDVMKVYDSGAGPALYVGSLPPGADWKTISRWDGVRWTGTGFPYQANGGVRAMEVYDDGNGPRLIVGGAFLDDNNAAVPDKLFSFNGSTWSAVPGATGTTVQAMCVYDMGDGPALYVKNGHASGVNKWNGSEWMQLGGPNGSVLAMIGFNNGSGPELWAAGQFSTIIGGASIANAARWNGTEWLAGGGSVWNLVLSFAVYDDGNGQKLFAGGASTASGNVRGVGRWNGTLWEHVNSGPGSWIHTLQVYNDGGGPALYAGGAFDTASNPAKFITRWNGQNWSVPGGVTLNGHVFALEPFNDGSLGGPSLFVGGWFTTLNGQPASRIARWSEPTADTDGDGILDHWETEGCGIDVNGDGIIDLDLFALGARPDHKDLFVEVDAMAGLAPDPQAIADVVAAFAAAPNELVNNPDGQPGVNLQVELVDDLDVPAAPWPNTFNDFAIVRAARFGTQAQREHPNAVNILEAKRRVYRYCIFGHSFSNSSYSGLGEVNGDEFMVTLGSWSTPGGTVEQQAGTFMHELGHTLGLRHGGGDDENYKPNYYSIMNYTWQMPKRWHVPGTRPLDYSRFALPALNEAELDECAGIGAPLGFFPGVFTIYNTRVGGNPLTALALMQGGASVDWNGTGAIVCNFSTSADLNRLLASDPASPDQVLAGHADWPNLDYNFRDDVNYLDGVHQVPDAHDELTAEVDDELDLLLPPWGFCTADISPTGGDGSVGIADLLLIINSWGLCSGCPADIVLDGVVGVPDLLAVINGWGPCR